MTHQGLISQQLGGHPSTAHGDREWRALVRGEKEGGTVRDQA